jgi:hypothetical protein
MPVIPPPGSPGGIITYALFRFIWEKDEQADRVAPSRHIDERQE